MAIPRNTRSLFFISIIVVAVLRYNLANEIEIVPIEAAIEFADRWLATPKMFFGIMLPPKASFRKSQIVQLATKIITHLQGRNSYFMFNLNITKYSDLPHTQHELIWYPINIEHYDLNCQFLDADQSDRLYKKHFLFLERNHKNRNFSFETCKLRFDSRLAIYHQKQHEESNKLSPKKDHLIVQFEEIYKLDENENKIVKNILGEIVYDQGGMSVSGFESYIWKRRMSLDGKMFNAVSQNGPNMAISVKQLKNSKGKTVIQHSGYIPEIMQHLMQRFDFSLNKTVLELSANDIVREVGSKQYDILYMDFSINLFRSSYVDFSLGLMAPSDALFYAKGSKKFDLETFLHPLQSWSWILVATYVTVLISGFVLVGMFTGDGTGRSTLKHIFQLLLKGSDHVFRSLIIKRQSSEPRICSSKIAFGVVVFAGFVTFSMYRAVLVAFLAAEEDSPPVDNLRGLMNTGLSLAISKGSAMDTVFVNGSPESVEYQLDKMGKVVRFNKINRYIDLMMEKESKASQTILFYLYDVVQDNDHYPCKLAKIKHSNRKAPTTTMMFQKNWPWKDLFNYHLLAMKESGLMERLYKRTMIKPRTICPHHHTINRIVKEPGPIGTSKTFSLYLILLLGMAASLLFFWVEKSNVTRHKVA